jgi:arginyl-tRNA synthetase
METLLKEKVASIVEQLYGFNISPAHILVNIPPKEQACDFTVVIFPIAKQAKKSPDQAAREIGEALQGALPSLAGFDVVKGFLNLRLTDQYWNQFFLEKQTDPQYGLLPPTGKKVMIEYCGPNTNKPLHLGHLRNIFIGFSMSRILKAAGNEVVKVNIYNDRGIHICKSMLAYQKFGHHETPESSGIKGDHLVGEYYVRFDEELRREVSELVAGGMADDEAKKSAPINKEIQRMLREWEEGNTAVRDLWAMMNGWVYQGFEQTYRRLGVDFDKAYYESETYKLGKTFVDEGLATGVFFKKEDGSVWVDLTADGLDQKLLLRADGTSVYITQDIGTANERWNDFHPDQMIYTVANEQDYHFKVLKLICAKLGKPYADGIYHLSYGMVDLPGGRMKSREGTVVDADDLIDEMETVAATLSKEQGKMEALDANQQEELFRMLGLGALKFFILKVDPKKRMVFNPEESIDFHGFTGPFIQYTHARIKSVLRKAASSGISPLLDAQAVEQKESQAGHDKTRLEPLEREIILHLQRYPAIIRESATAYSPAILANYLYYLAKTYNQFYQELPILSAEKPEQRDFRLLLSSFVADVLKKGMWLLGIEVPERM